MLINLPSRILEAAENDTSLMTEVQRFWIEPISYVPRGHKWQPLKKQWTSLLAVRVVEWLQVSQILPCPSNPFKLIRNDRIPCF